MNDVCAQSLPRHDGLKTALYMNRIMYKWKIHSIANIVRSEVYGATVRFYKSSIVHQHRTVEL